MNFLNEFKFTTLESAEFVKNKIYEKVKKDDYITYYELFHDILIVEGQNKINFPDIYHKFGWLMSDILGMRIEESTIYDETVKEIKVWLIKLPPIKNIGIKIKKESKQNE